MGLIKYVLRLLENGTSHGQVLIMLPLFIIVMITCVYLLYLL